METDVSTNPPKVLVTIQDARPLPLRPAEADAWRARRSQADPAR
jgi:hypothetical protein